MILGIGVDICKNQRMKLEIYKKILSDEEITAFDSLKLEKRKIEYLCSRFAAKEAVFKALSQTGIKVLIREIVILSDELGRPIVKKPVYKDKQILVSISHEIDYSIAYAVVEEIYKR
jgi:holo-[acyl-carrier protein] synthase